LDFVMEYFIKGVPALPAEGMQAIPEQLATRLHNDSLHLNTWVHGIDGTHVSTDAGRQNARAVIVATDQDTASAWTGSENRGWRGVTTWYHVVEDARENLAGGKARLTIDSVMGRGPVINTIPISHVAATYAPAGKHLISSSVLGTDTSAEMSRAVLQHLAVLYGTNTSAWQNVAVYPVEKALPISLPPLVTEQSTRIRDGLFVAGDHMNTPSINGAMASGRIAAKAAIAELRRFN